VAGVDIRRGNFQNLNPADALQDLRDENSQLLRSVADSQRVISEMTSQAAVLERRVLEEAAIAKNLTAQLEVKSVYPGSVPPEACHGDSHYIVMTLLAHGHCYSSLHS
jgi:hypothetical protein